jgi:PAS domain S-box-containing protein
LDGVLLDPNPAMHRMLGYEAGELRNRNLFELTDPRDTEISKGAVSELKNGRKNRLTFEKRYLTKKGEVVWASLTSSMVRDAIGQPTFFISIVEDISERKHWEELIRRSEKMSAVGQLAAGIAHEINNPLAVILGFAETMADRIEPGAGLEVPVKSIQPEALRCKTLVEKLLTFSRTSRTDDRSEIDLNQAIEDALALVVAQARVDQSRITRDLAPSLPPILGNSNEVQQVVINLATNALDAMPGGGTLTLSSHVVDEEGGSFVCLEVRDTGEGIPSEIAEKIFDPFFTTKPPGKGTGLGLSLTHEILEKHSAVLEVTSRPGDTRFWAKFPIAEKHSGASSDLTPDRRFKP